MSPKIIETGRDAQASPAEDPGVDRGRQAETEARDEIKKVSLETNVETVDLPSGYAFYDVDGIGVRNFKFREYALLATAQEAGSFRSLAEAVANTVIGMDAMKMTYGDFQYVMYLHRLRMKRPFTIEWECDAPEHVAGIASGKYPEGSLKQTTRLSSSDLETNRPDPEKIAALLSGGELEPGLMVHPPRVIDVIETAEDMDAVWDDASERGLDHAAADRMAADLAWRNTYASLLHPDHGETVKERREYMDTWFDAREGDHHEVLERLNGFRAASEHGVIETAKLVCEVCGAEAVRPIRFSPADFFPSAETV